MSGNGKAFLWPREHGAWAQMALPLATALLAGRPGAAAWLIAVAAALAFLGHEPALVLLGTRGPRARADDGALASRLLLVLGGSAGLAGLAGLWLAPQAARLAAVAPVALAAATALLARRRLEMTTGGEVVAGAAMAAAGLPVALAAGAPARAAAAAFAAWSLSFALAAIAVEAVLARGRPGARDLGPRNALLSAAVWAGSLLLAAAGLPWVVPLALAPTALFAAGVCLARVGPQRLRRLGWLLVAATLAMLVLLVAGLRA
ncbi:MAG TPA: YwiC-like family protein [Anaeromyxobacteraceae bacterium]